MKRYLWILLFALSVQVCAQVKSDVPEQIFDEFATDTLFTDSIKSDSIPLPWAQSVQKKLDEVLTKSMFETSQVGLIIYDLDTDSTIYAHNQRQLMRPASTMKLVTAIAGIDKLSGSYRFKTDLCYTGKVENKTLTGDIYCVGGFDPRFNSDDMNAFVESLSKMGVDTIVGNIYADKSMKDADSYGAGWCWDDDNPTLSPLLLNGKDVFMPRFVDMLTKSGIVLRVNVGEAVKPEDAFCICTRFHTIDQILMPMMKESENLYAESMLYQIALSSGARPATAKGAREVINRLINKVGLNSANYHVADGSGLSLYNYVSAELEMRLLRYAYNNSNIYQHLLPSLPIAGIDGTLKNRMKSQFMRGNVRAKTGTLMGVISLAGYCVGSNGHNLCFAIINQGVMHSRNARNFQDLVCTILCSPQ